MNKDWQEATAKGNIEKVRLLLDSGININAKDKYCQTALMNAARAGHVELVRLLVEKGADLNVTAKYNLSATMLAVLCNRANVVQVLAQAGADLSIQGSNKVLSLCGKTARQLAEEAGYSEIVAALKEAGAT